MVNITIRKNYDLITNIREPIEEFAPLVAFYNKEKGLVRVFAFNFMYLLMAQNFPNIDPAIHAQIMSCLPLPDGFPVILNGSWWFVNWSASITDPLSAKLKITTNSNSRVLPGYHALDRRTPNSFEKTVVESEISGRKFLYYEDFYVNYDDVMLSPESTISFSGSFELKVKGTIDFGLFEIRPSDTLRAHFDELVISLPGVQNHTNPEIKKPHYNKILGVASMNSSPVFEARFRKDACNYHIKTGCAPSHNYKLTTLPTGWTVNSELGLVQTPINTQMALNFVVQQRKDNANVTAIDHSISGILNNPFFNLISTTSDSTDFFYHFQTDFVDPELLQDFVLWTRNSEISDMNVIVKTTFNRTNNSSLPPLLYTGMYKPMPIEPYHNQTIWPMTLKVITTSQTINSVASNAKYVVDNGATLTVSNVTFNSQIDSYGFDVRNGKLVFNNCKFLTNVGHVGATGAFSEVIIQNCSNSNNQINSIKINNGAKLTIINNSVINVSLGVFSISGNGSQFVKSSNSQLKIASSEINILDGAQINANDFILQENLRIICSGNDSKIEFNNLNDITSIKNLELINGAKLYINGTKVKILDGALDMSGQGTKIVLNNNSEIFLSGTNMNV